MIEPRDIFVCYGDGDAVEAAGLVAQLEQVEGWTCWYASRDIPHSHDDSTEKIYEAINKCTVFLLLSSDNTMGCDNVHVALSQAMAQGKKRIEHKIGTDFSQTVNALDQYLQGVGADSPSEGDYEDVEQGALSKIGPIVMMLAIIIIGAAVAITVFVRGPRGHPSEMAAEPYVPRLFVDAPVVAARIGAARLMPERIIQATYQARHQDTEAMFNLGHMFTDIGNYEMAAYWLRHGANRGHLYAQVALSFMYWDGRGIQQDRHRGAHWFHAAAMQGHPEMQNNAGVIFRDGNYMPQCYDQALYWFHKAAEHNLPSAQLNLGIMYVNGIGVTQCHIEAEYWFRKAAMQNSPRGQAYLGLLYERGAGVEQSYDMAIYWFTRAYEGGHEWAGEKLEELLAQQH